MNYQPRLFKQKTGMTIYNDLTSIPSFSVELVLASFGGLNPPEKLDQATRILKPGGYLLILISQSFLPEIGSPPLSEEVTYQWTLAVLQDEHQQVEKRVLSGWLPGVVFQKGERRDKDKWRGDVIKPNDPRYTYTGNATMARLISEYSYPGETILVMPHNDATCLIAQESERHYIGYKQPETHNGQQ